MSVSKNAKATFAGVALLIIYIACGLMVGAGLVNAVNGDHVLLMLGVIATALTLALRYIVFRLLES